MLRERLLPVMLVCGLYLSSLGCGGASSQLGLPKVSGTVTLDGQPLEEGRIVLRDPSGTAAGGGTKIEHGSFHLEVSSGPKRVEITAKRAVPGKFDESNPGEKIPLLEQYIPARYNSSSELQVEVSAEQKNHFTFELTSEK